MAYEVLARKWRPQQFSDVVGQDHVTQTLINAIETQRLAHAYLFVGPRGIGKTSLARIFSKALNCASGPTPTPCDTCETCREIVTGNSLDVMEIDGASNNGVEQVRELRETVKYLPVRASFKIYIIDEVHMLSPAAFNALLKTLEEPPPHVKFLFATTEPDKILSTIVSRCQRFDLRRISVPLIMERLRLIAADEELAIDEDALLAIARGAEGGLRDAESSLDQLISFKGKTIREEDVLSVFGLVSRGMLQGLADNILAGDVKQLIRSIAELDAGGKDLQRLVLELLEYFRNLLVCLHMGDATEGLDLPESQVAVLREQGEKAREGRVLRILEILAEAQGRLKYALSRRTLLETSLIRCARAATVVTLDEILEKVEALRSGGNGSARASSGHSEAAPPTSPSTSAASGQRVVAESKAPSYRVQEEGVEDDGERPGELEQLKEKWTAVTQRISRIAPLLRGCLVDTGPLSVTKDRVVIGCDAEFAEELRSLSDSRSRAAVERVLRDELGRRVVATFETSARVVVPSATLVETPDERAEEEPSAADAPVVVDAEQPRRKSAQEWAKEPIVRESLDLFDGYIAEIRE